MTLKHYGKGRQAHANTALPIAAAYGLTPDGKTDFGPPENACGTGLLKGAKGEKADGKTDNPRPGRMEVNKNAG